MTAKIPGWRPPLDHEPHTFTLSPNSTLLCICGLSQTHHIHLGVSSAACTYMCCLGDKNPDMCGRCYLNPNATEDRNRCKCPPDPIPSSPAQLMEDQ